MLRTKLIPVTVAILSVFVAIFLMAVKPSSQPPESANELITLVNNKTVDPFAVIEPIAIDISDAKFISFLGKTSHNIAFFLNFFPNPVVMVIQRFQDLAHQDVALQL